MSVPSNFPTDFASMLQRLESRDEKSIAVYDRRGKTLETHPYPEVVARARAWGAWFRAQGVQADEVVYLCLPTSHDLIEAFLGLILIGALPCNLALPRAVGGLPVFKRRLEQLRQKFPGGYLVTTADVGAEAGDPFWTPPELDLTQQVALDPIDANRLAYVQLTSGSTTTPKAVAISHANAAANTHGIYTSGGGDPSMQFVSWLPLYHDMGLVGIVLTAMFGQTGLVLMRPETFVGTPLRWLQAIAAQTDPVVTSAPNFGYQWCVDRIRPGKEEGLDLSPLAIACCGAEMVRPGTLTAFQDRFGPRGFKAGSFVPCYGMAETTLAVSFCPPGRPPVIHEERVSCGPAIEGLEISIRDPETDAVRPDREEGEIVVRGSSIFVGYHLEQAATDDVLRDGWFHTGDLGYLHEGELYVTGRLKDLIILDGSNVAPYELEWVAEQHLDMDGGRAAAFSIEPEGREVPVLVIEVKEIPERALLDAVSAQVGQDIAPLHDMVLVRRGTLPKTSSGKVRRATVKQRYLSGELESLWNLREQS